MSQTRAILALIVAAAGFSLWAYGPSAAEAARPFETAQVKLYSNGKIVGEWEAVGAGRVEGDTFVFPVRQGVQDLDVRIRGTFSYEVQP